MFSNIPRTFLVLRADCISGLLSEMPPMAPYKRPEQIDARPV